MDEAIERPPPWFLPLPIAWWVQRTNRSCLPRVARVLRATPASIMDGNRRSGAFVAGGPGRNSLNIAFQKPRIDPAPNRRGAQRAPAARGGRRWRIAQRPLLGGSISKPKRGGTKGEFGSMTRRALRRGAHPGGPFPRSCRLRPQIAPPLEFQGRFPPRQEAESLEPGFQFRVFLLEIVPRGSGTKATHKEAQGNGVVSGWVNAVGTDAGTDPPGPFENLVFDTPHHNRRGGRGERGRGGGGRGPCRARLCPFPLAWPLGGVATPGVGKSQAGSFLRIKLSTGEVQDGGPKTSATVQAAGAMSSQTKTNRPSQGARTPSARASGGSGGRPAR